MELELELTWDVGAAQNCAEVRAAVLVWAASRQS